MKNKDLIHLKFEYEDALEAKKAILTSEKEVMTMAKVIGNYSSLRKNELKKKIILSRKLKEMISLIKKLQKEIPEVDVPEEIKKEPVQDGPKPIRQKKPTKHDNSIENQLRDIQEKLRSLE